MSDLRLSSDRFASIQSHLQELSKRITAVIILISILTVIWSFSVGDILTFSLREMDPCNESCLSVFSPQEWAGVKWLTAAILGILTSGPYAIIQMYYFVRPGLLPSERRTFIFWTITIWMSAVTSLFLVSYKLLPWLFNQGHSLNQNLELTPMYDATEILKISIVISWTIILVMSAVTVIVIAHFSDLIWRGNADWWRVRVYGMMLMLLWFAIPNEVPGLYFMLAIISIAIVELFGWRAYRAPIPAAHGLEEIFDSEGGVHRVLYSDCSCCGTSPQITPLKGMGIVRYKSVCRETEQQDHLLDQVKKFRVTKVVFSGCTIETFPTDYLRSFDILKCETSSLELTYLDNIKTHASDIDYKLAMANLRNPWSDDSATKRCMEILSSYGPEKIHYGTKIPFGLNLSTSEAWITNPSNELVSRMKEFGYSVIHHSN